MDARPQRGLLFYRVRSVLVTGEWTLGRNGQATGAKVGQVLVTGEWTLGRNWRGSVPIASRF